MTATRISKIAASAALVCVAVAATVGVAAFNSGPDLSLVPTMAERPVSLPDGTIIHVQKFETTAAEWQLCYNAGACALKVRPRHGFDPERTPATGLSYMDVGEYLEWIREETGQPFRLPTLAEWTAMAEEVLPEAPDPIFTDPALTWASTYLVENLPGRTLKESGSFSTTTAGIVDLDGSVWEWTQECFNGEDADRCPAFFAGGEHLAAISYLVRDPARGGCAVGAPPAHLGFRLVSDQPFPRP